MSTSLTSSSIDCKQTEIDSDCRCTCRCASAYLNHRGSRRLDHACVLHAAARRPLVLPLRRGQLKPKLSRELTVATQGRRQVESNPAVAAAASPAGAALVGPLSHHSRSLHPPDQTPDECGRTTTVAHETNTPTDGRELRKGVTLVERPSLSSAASTHGRKASKSSTIT